MELLIVTLATVYRNRHNDAQTYTQQLLETIANAAGLLHVRAYRSIGTPHSYCLLSTWEDEESWQKAQSRYNPATLFQSHPELFHPTPEQWQMYYQWGFSRPAQNPRLCALHISTLPTKQADLIQKYWLDSLRHPMAYSTLAYAFLARSIDKDATQPRRSLKSEGVDQLLNQHIPPRGNTLIAFLNWPGEDERDTFYMDPRYRLLTEQIQAIGDHRQLHLHYL